MNCLEWCLGQSKPSASVRTNTVVMWAMAVEQVGSPVSTASEGGAQPKFLEKPLVRNGLRDKHQRTVVSEALAERVR